MLKMSWRFFFRSNTIILMGSEVSFEPQGCCNIGSMTKSSFACNVLVNGQNTSGYSMAKRTIKVMVLPK